MGHLGQPRPQPEGHRNTIKNIQVFLSVIQQIRAQSHKKNRDIAGGRPKKKTLSVKKRLIYIFFLRTCLQNLE